MGREVGAALPASNLPGHSSFKADYGFFADFFAIPLFFLGEVS
jgi:hypothetical protein